MVHHNEGLDYNKETVLNKDLSDNEYKEIEKAFVQKIRLTSIRTKFMIIKWKRRITVRNESQKIVSISQ